MGTLARQAEIAVWVQALGSWRWRVSRHIALYNFETVCAISCSSVHFVLKIRSIMCC